jgi:hypothetical protein
MKKRIDFVKIKLHSNQNIEWHYMQLELNWTIYIIKKMLYVYVSICALQT